MRYTYLAIALSVAILTVCIGRAVDDTPLWTVIGLVFSAFTFGFIIGDDNT
jgi:hypothetical protein